MTCKDCRFWTEGAVPASLTQYNTCALMRKPQEMGLKAIVVADDAGAHVDTRYDFHCSQYKRQAVPDVG